jgi:hypothetical protein
LRVRPRQRIFSLFKALGISSFKALPTYASHCMVTDACVEAVF